jgi:hypothetical protein
VPADLAEKHREAVIRAAEPRSGSRSPSCRAFLANAKAAARHVGLVRRYNRGEPARFTPVSVSVVLSGLLAVLGLLLAGYLLRLG